MLTPSHRAALWLVAACAFCHARPAAAQPLAPYRPYYYGSSFGLFTGGYGGFYSNGFSMYGPPVPTYGPVPGAFGGADQRFDLDRLPPPPPRYKRKYATSVGENEPVYVVTPGATADDLPPPVTLPQTTEPPLLHAAPPAQAPSAPRPRTVPYMPKVPEDGAANGSARLDVVVPHAEAELWIDDSVTRQSGKQRQFGTPPLEGGKTYLYEVKAAWGTGADRKTRTRMVTVQRGGRYAVDFTREEP